MEQKVNRLTPTKTATISIEKTPIIKMQLKHQQQIKEISLINGNGGSCGVKSSTITPPLTNKTQITTTPTTTTTIAITNGGVGVGGGGGGAAGGNGNGSGSGSNNKQCHAIPSDILDDLSSRFIINSPVDERNNLIRLCFQIELAHWFYLDFFCEIVEKKLVPCGIKQFTIHLFQHIPFFRKHLSGIDKILEDWKEYKLTVPTYGAILVSEDLNYVLLVQSYWAKSSWGFPKGKINENEDPVHCATREVYEETGYDITELIVPKDYIEAVINYQYTRLYIIRNVPITTQFSPRTRKEIKSCDWFPLDSLPVNKNDVLCKQQLGRNANSFFMIMPFMKRLKKFINDNRSGIEHKFSSSPITTFNNGENYFGGGTGNSNNKSSAKKLILDLQQQQQQQQQNPKQQQYEKNDNFINNCNNNSFALKNNNNNNNSKRQRHKSMGDIDGIKLININNNTTNNLMAKTFYNNASTKVLLNNMTSTPKTDDNYYFPNNNKQSKNILQSSVSMSATMMKVYFNDSNQSPTIIGQTAAAAPPPPSIIPNSKRQLFNCTNVDNNIKSGRCTTFQNNSNDMMMKKEKTKRNNGTNNENNSNSKKKEISNIKDTNTKLNNKKLNNSRNRTKSLSQQQNQNIQNIQNVVNQTSIQRKNSSNSNESSSSMDNCSITSGSTGSSNNGQNKKINNPQLKSPKLLKQTEILTLYNIEKQQQQDQQQRQQIKQTEPLQLYEIEKEQQQQQPQVLQTQIIEKFNPNFDTWTNFSFTKNFIANVFC